MTRFLLLAAALLAVLSAPLRADDKGEDTSVEAFIRTFLEEQPRFKVAGTFTIKQPGKPPVECGARLRFDRENGAVFAYNTTGADVEPYDFYFWNKNLALFVYDRQRTTVTKAEWLDTPYRMAFNFVWDVLREAEKGAGFHTLLFSGLMRMELRSRGGLTEVLFLKRFGPMSVEKITFVFDSAYHLRSMQLEEANGAVYSFKAQTYEKMNKKLPRPNIKKKPSASWW